MIESNFYSSPNEPSPAPAAPTQENKAQALADQLALDPQLLAQAMQIFLAAAQNAQGSKIF